MTPLSDGPRMEKNYWLALVLSLGVLMGYPLLLRWLTPSRLPEAPVKESAPIERSGAPAGQTAVHVLSAAEDPFLEKPEAPAIVRFENRHFEVDLSNLGASISRLAYKGEDGQTVTNQTVFFEAAGAGPGIFAVRLLNEPADLSRVLFKPGPRGSDGKSFEFLYEKPGEYRLVKRYRFEDGSPVFRITLAVENLSAQTKQFAYELIYGIQYELSETLPARDFESVAWTDRAESAALDKIAKKGFSVIKPVKWSGALKKYFAVLVKPEWEAIAQEASSDERAVWNRLTMAPVGVAPGVGASRDFLIYAGPQRYEMLKGADLGFENILSRGFFGLFKIWLLLALKFCYRFTYNYGWALILLTMLLKLAFTPLTHMSYGSMKKMQALQPKLKSLQARYKNDPAKLNQEMMQLYRRNRVNPMGGCLPMLLQIPIFIAFYQVLSETIELKGAPFMAWMRDLSEPDRLAALPFSLPFLGDGVHVLPVLMSGSMFWQQQLTPQAGATPEQTKMMAFMPLFMFFVFYKMPSGLVLYWFVNNVLSIIHQVVIKRMVVVLHHEDRD